MYRTFSEYKQLREATEFGEKTIRLYESIIYSGLSFDDWWLKHGMPKVLEQNYSNEEELLMELMGGVGQFLGNAAGRATQGIQNFGKGLSSGWQQGRQAVPVWQPSGGLNPNIQAQGGEQPQEQPQAAQNSNSEDLQGQILGTHQQLIQKLKELQAVSAQNRDAQSYQAVQNLMSQMQTVPNVIRNLQLPQASPGQQNQQKVQNIDPAKRQAFANRNTTVGGNVSNFTNQATSGPGLPMRR